jgi:hypothetical protein
MALSREDIFRNALALEQADRAELIGLLIESLDSATEDGVEAAWLEEIGRRARELESGSASASWG